LLLPTSGIAQHPHRHALRCLLLQSLPRHRCILPRPPGRLSRVLSPEPSDIKPAAQLQAVAAGAGKAGGVREAGDDALQDLARQSCEERGSRCCCHVDNAARVARVRRTSALCNAAASLVILHFATRQGNRR
jgi:hypothetical protein